MIPAKRKFSFRTKDIKQIINSPEWDRMHFDMEVKYCDYPNHDCLKVKELDCKDCRVYKLKNLKEG